MLSEENDCVELEENLVEFQDVCCRLKKHTLSSPWKMFFQTSDEEEFSSEVTELIVDNNINTDTNPTVADLLPDKSSDVFMKNEVTSSQDMQIDKKKVCRLKESLLNIESESTVDCIKDFDIFFTVSSFEIPLLFQMLDITSLKDSSLSLILNAFLHFKDQISIATATALVHHVIFPLIFDKKNSSRYLLSTILKFAEIYPKAVIDEVLIPYSKKETSDDLQSELVSQIAKTSLPNEYVFYSIKSVLEHALPVDNSFLLLQCLIERKVHHDSLLYNVLLKKLHDWTSHCNKNVKFAKLLTSILSTYGNELNEQQIQLCEKVVEGNKTIIKKAAENLLKRLKQENS